MPDQQKGITYSTYSINDAMHPHFSQTEQTTNAITKEELGRIIRKLDSYLVGHRS